MKAFEIIEENKGKYLDFLCRICSFEARADDKCTIDQMVDHIADFAKADVEAIAKTEFVPGTSCKQSMLK